MENLYLKNNIFFIWKPSKFFQFLSIVSFIIWIFLGPIWWRHVDDFGPIQFLIKGEWSFFDSYQLLDGFGSYPPIWTLWTAISYFFKNINLTESRYISLLQGYFSCILSAYLTMTVCLNILVISVRKNNLEISRLKPIIEILSITFNLFNPEVMLHSSTYMPYNLASITTLMFILFLIPLDWRIAQDQLISSKYLFKISYLRFIAFLYLSIFFSFQSIIILLGFFITNIYIQIFSQFDVLNKQYIVSFFREFYQIYRDSFINKKRFFNYFINLFLLYLPISYIYKILVLSKRNVKPGSWANGLDNIYDLEFFKYGIYEWLTKCINNTISIIGQSLFPFRYYQDKASIILGILVLLSFFFIRKFNYQGKILSINLGVVFCLTICLSSFGNFIYSPSRHTIFLYPYIWILSVLFFSNLYINIFSKFNFKVYKYLMSFISAIFIFSAAGLINSHQLIQYSSNLRSLLLEMANKSDFYIDDIYLLEGVSLYSSHGSNEYDAVKNKKCSVNKLENKKEISFFVYNHRFPLDIENNKEHLNDLIGHSNGCIRNDDIVETIQKIEKTRNFDIEQNNRIYNGGSSAYAYLLKVIKAD